MISIMSDLIQSIFENGKTHQLEKSDVLFRAGDAVSSMHFVIDGSLDLVRHSQTGIKLILQRAKANQVLAEASAHSDHYHCDAVATQPTVLTSVPKRYFHAILTEDNAVNLAWLKHLSSAVQAARYRAEIRTLKTVSDRLDAWLDFKGTIPPKGQLQNLAEELGVSREALYRELARRRIH
jgi:CRP/FNR family transcriptional regulator, dissimilatory nitrate respiration regulator